VGVAEFLAQFECGQSVEVVVVGEEEHVADLFERILAAGRVADSVRTDTREERPTLATRPGCLHPIRTKFEARPARRLGR
jgi:hypothetical protein